VVTLTAHFVSVRLYITLSGHSPVNYALNCINIYETQWLYNPVCVLSVPLVCFNIYINSMFINWFVCFDYTPNGVFNINIFNIEIFIKQI
jgi:hypothetical protein